MITLSMRLPLWAENSDNLDQLFEEEKYHTVLEMIFPNAQAGDLDAQLLLAKMYHEGKGLEKDYNKASYGYVAPQRLIMSKRIKLGLN